MRDILERLRLERRVAFALFALVLLIHGLFWAAVPQFHTPHSAAPAQQEQASP